MKIGTGYGTLLEGYEKKWGEEGADVFKSCGFSCLDYSLANTEEWEYTEPEEEVKKKLSELSKNLENKGILVNQVHGPWRYPPRDLSIQDRKERMEKMNRSIRMCASLGCKRWVIHPVMPFGTEDIGSGNEEKTWEINLEFMRELLLTAKEEGVIICFENMPFTELSISSPESIIKFVDEINDDNFKICLDTGHANVFSGKSLGDVVRLMGKRIEVLHVHDNDGNADQHLLPYMGTIDWEDFGRALSEIGFDGVFSYETDISHNMPDEPYELMNRALVEIAKKICKN